MAERFYVNCPLAVGEVELHGPEAHHLAHVCRLRAGAVVCLFNGDGRQYHAEVVTIGKRQVGLRVQAVETPAREVGFRLEVAAPLPKGDRAQFLIEKLTELGVTRFVPLRTARSVVEPHDAKMDKLARYVIEASKQCGRNVLLEVMAAADWADFCGRGDLPRTRILAHPSGPAVAWPSGEDVVLAVGPEGGWTEEEAEQGRAAGWRVVGLGPRVLRVETAAIVLAVRAGQVT